GRRRRSRPAAPSGGPPGRAELGEEEAVELQGVVVLGGDLRLGVDRVDRARLDARIAVDADRRVDVELLRRLEVGGARLGVDAVHGTDLDARVVLDAAANDDVGHGRQATYLRILSAFRPIGRSRRRRTAYCAP